MKRGDILEVNGKKVMVDAVLGNGNYAFHEVTETTPKKDAEAPNTEEKEVVKEEVKEVKETPKKKARRK